MAQVVRSPYPEGLLFSEHFIGTDTTVAASVTEMQPYASNPNITDSTISTAGGYPKEGDAIKIGSTYYMVVTAWSNYAGAAKALVLIKSTDLTSWSYVQTVKSNAHAATLFEWNSAYHILYSTTTGNNIGHMSTTNVESTWTDHGAVLSGQGVRDPFVVIESGTVYMYTTHTDGSVRYFTTTATDFTGWSASTTAIALPAGVTTNEAPYIVKVGSTYYLFLAEMPLDSGTLSTSHNGVVYTASSITGPWTKWGYAFVKGSQATWHDESIGHLTFVRSGDIEDNAAPLQVGDYYPVFTEGGDGTEWSTGFYYGQIRHTRPAVTWVITTRAMASVDVPGQRLWLEKYNATSADTILARLSYALPGSTSLWRIETKVGIDLFGPSGSDAGVGLLGYKDASNWWIVRVCHGNDVVNVGRLSGGGWSWKAAYSTTINRQTDYQITVRKTASQTVSIYLNGTLLGSVVDAIFDQTSVYVGMHTWWAAGDMDWIEVWDS